MAMKRVLVTGGAGYIGSVLVPELLHQKWQVRVVDNLYFGKQSLQPVLNRIELIKTDIREVNAKIMQGVDAVVHLAALSNDPMANFAPDVNFSVNTEGTIRLARMAKEAGVRRFVFASSCSIYHRERQNHQLKHEESWVDPKEHYSRSKYFAEQSILAMANDKFAVTALRKGTVVGYSPRLRFDLAANTMIKTALTTGRVIVFDGSQYRPIVDVRDAARAYLMVLRAPVEKVRGQIFNVVGKNYTMLQLADRVAKSLKQLLKTTYPVEVKSRIKDRTYRVSAAKIKRILGFKPKFSIEKSVASLVKYVTKQSKFNFNHHLYYNIETMKRWQKR